MPTPVLVLWSDHAGQGLAEHTAPFDAIVMVLDGTFTLTIGGQPVTATSGTVVRMPANIPHAVDAVEPGGEPHAFPAAHRPAAAVEHGIAQEKEGDGEDHGADRHLRQAASLHRSGPAARHEPRHEPGVHAS